MADTDQSVRRYVCTGECTQLMSLYYSAAFTSSDITQTEKLH